MIPKVVSTYEDEEKNVFGSRTIFLMILLYRILGLSNVLILPQIAFTNGVMGTLIYLTTSYIFLGIPMTYMELTISQFTGRDCIDMWKIRPCLSHIGYFVQFWQLVAFTYNHVIISILFHYLIISFENPPLFSQCGFWTTKTCNIIKFNHTANNRCVRARYSVQECQDVYTTYPEYQYYLFNLFEGNKREFLVSWPICVSSTVVIIILFLNCFKRITSIKWFIYPLTYFPITAYILLLIVSMRQKGFLMYFAEIMDVDFEHFTNHGHPINIMMQTLFSVGAGSGIISNLASLAPFRSPCFSNAVTAVLTSASFTVVAVTTSAMMACPYTLEYGGDPYDFLSQPVSFVFIKLPRMLDEYEKNSMWNLLAFSCLCTSGISNNIVIFYALLETTAKKIDRIRKYSALTTFLVVLIIFIITIPIPGTVGKDIISISIRKYIFLVTTFFAMLETIVFMIWYGFDRFYEDIHFMQGIQPKAYMKVSWMLLPFLLAYIFCQSLIVAIEEQKTNKERMGFVLMLTAMILPVVIILVKLVVAAFRKKFVWQLKLDELWGPRSEVLRRSRAMFTAHAMTKEYMYRQHHVQAGIVARQRLSNARAARSNNAAAPST